VRLEEAYCAPGERGMTKVLLVHELEYLPNHLEHSEDVSSLHSCGIDTQTELSSSACCHINDVGVVLVHLEPEILWRGDDPKFCLIVRYVQMPDVVVHHHISKQEYFHEIVSRGNVREIFRKKVWRATTSHNDLGVPDEPRLELKDSNIASSSTTIEAEYPFSRTPDPPGKGPPGVLRSKF
jgi:hypothetical protein